MPRGTNNSHTSRRSSVHQQNNNQGCIAQASRIQLTFLCVCHTTADKMVHKQVIRTTIQNIRLELVESCGRIRKVILSDPIHVHLTKALQAKPHQKEKIYFHQVLIDRKMNPTPVLEGQTQAGFCILPGKKMQPTGPHSSCSCPGCTPTVFHMLMVLFTLPLGKQLRYSGHTASPHQSSTALTKNIHMRR